MSVSLSDVLAPTILPSTAGAVAPASAKGQDGAFAQELAATQVGTGGTSAEATIPPAANLETSSPATQQWLAEVRAGTFTGIRIDPSKMERVDTLRVESGNVMVVTTPERLAELAPKLDIDPAIIERILGGNYTEADAKALVDAVKQDKKTLSSGEELLPEDIAASAALDPSVVTAAPPAAVEAAAPQTDAALTATADSEEIALKIADEKRPYIPPRPEIPDAQKQQPVVQEGRATATAPPPTSVAPTSIETPETSSAVKALFDQIAPRAAANVTISVDTKPQTQPAPSVVQQQPASTPVPAAAQAIANTPNLTSIQGTVTAAADASAEAPVQTSAPASTPASAPNPTAQAVPTPITSLPEEAITPATTTAPVPPKVADATTAAPLTPPPAEGEAIEAAMTALTKDKSEVKAEAAPQIAKPETAAAPQKTTEAPATDEPELAGKPAADTSAKDVKPEAKPELQSKPAEKPVVAEKPAAPDVKVQAQLPVIDKPILADASVRSVQQQMQNLPAQAIPQIAGEMAARFKQGATLFEIRLDPPELGRVDVRIEVDRDGNVHSRLMVEKSETLDLLKADQRALERALHEAGFKSEQNSMSFSLKDDRGGQQKFAEQQRFLREMNQSQQAVSEEPSNVMANIAYRASMRGPGGVDMRV